jgi:predicted nucleotide-binding protein
MAKKTSEKIFIVHGRNETIRTAVSQFLLGLGKVPVVLMELASGGRTVIEKFEYYARDVKYAIVLLTPDDVGGLLSSDIREARARQNAIFELGYFIATLGRGKVCLMCSPDIELPSDLHGVVYIPIDSENQWGWALVHEFLHAKIDLDTASVAKSCAALLSRLK